MEIQKNTDNIKEKYIALISFIIGFILMLFGASDPTDITAGNSVFLPDGIAFAFVIVGVILMIFGILLILQQCWRNHKN